MYINRKNDQYMLSVGKEGSAVCRVLPPILVFNGEEKTGRLLECGENKQVCRIGGAEVTDVIRERGNGIFTVTRRIVNRDMDPIRFKSVFEVRTEFLPEHFVFPGFNYDTSCSPVKVSAGEILNTSREGLKSSVVNTPTGLEKDGKPWVFAYDREGIPSATLSENKEQVFALFASDEDAVSLESSASMIRNADGTLRHRILHPISEMPYTYAHKNTLIAPLERYFTLNAGEELSFSFYLFAGTPKFPEYGTVTLMEACADIFPFRQKPELTPQEVWDLGISYFRFLQKDADGVPMFSGHICDKLFPVMHSGELNGEALAKALEDPENRKLNTFSRSYEIGWAGQVAMIARLFAENGYRTGNEKEIDIAERCLDGFVATQRESGLLFPSYGQKDLPEEKRRVPDACNMGWAMCELMRSYRLFREHGKIKQNYYDFSVRLAEFALRTYNDDHGFGKTWDINGKPLSTEGSIGGFMIMGLCEVHKETGEKKYLDAIVKAMDFYYHRDLDHFICTAGALDCACVDKETAYPFFESALYLYDLTGEAIWLERAEKAAGYFFSWMFFYDCLYDADADFTKYGYHTVGGTIVSAEHSVIDSWGALMVNGMFRLWHATGNENYKLWARMTWWNALLCITTEKTPEIHGNRRPLGSQNEGFFHCRWTKYRPTCEERGHFNDNLQSWMGAWRVHTLNEMKEEDVALLWGNERS